MSFVSLCFATMIFPLSASAATLSLDPKSGTYGPGDMFIVTVRLDTTASECVNVAMIELSYPSDWIKATAVSKGESLLTLWTDEPKIDIEHGKISFAGGIPAGYCGRVQGDPGKSNVLAKIVFNVPGNMIGGKVATGPVALPLLFGTSSTVLLNDGFGTPAQVTLKGAMLERSLSSTQLKNEWLDVVHNDSTPPDSFIATIEHDPNIFEGRYFLAFTTVDKQSGINHYEVREDDPEKLDFVRGKNLRAEFVESKNLYYYELKDQELKSRITVRAVDNARNHTDWIIAPLRGAYARTEGVSSSTPRSDVFTFWALGLFILLFVVGGGYALFIRRKKESEMINDLYAQEPPHNE